MSNVPASETIAGFASSVADAKPKTGLKVVGKTYAAWIEEDGLGAVCREIYTIRLKELSE